MVFIADGAWGLRFPTLAAAEPVLVPAPDWPAIGLEVRHLPAPNVDQSSDWDSTGMRVPLAAGGHLRVVWPFAVTLSLPGHPVAECVVQPHLTTAAASISMRQGQQPLHAGAFELNGMAWGLLGAKEAGKSSTLALASQRGLGIVTDDLLVASQGAALAGPRCVDLRPEAARALDMGEDLGVVGLRERWRVRVGPCPSAVPIGGFILPSWGDDEMSWLPPVVRLQKILSFSAMHGITMNDPARYLDLASLPMLSWARPKSWSTAQPSFDMLLERLVSS
jgi:hypothetical protein